MKRNEIISQFQREHAAAVLNQEAERPRDKELVEDLEDWFEDARRHRSTQSRRWAENEKIHTNAMAHMFDGDKHKAKVKVNLSLINVRSQMAILMEHLSRVDIIGKNRTAVEYADIMHRRVNDAMNDNGLQEAVEAALHTMLVKSNGILLLKPTVNNIALPYSGRENTEPQTEVDAIYQAGFQCSHRPVESWYPAPDTAVHRKLDLDSGLYQVFVTFLHVFDIYRQYGVKVAPEGYIDESGTWQRQKDVEKSEQMKCEMAMVKECYRWDMDMENYPNGRYTIWCNGLLLEDRPLWGTTKYKLSGVDYTPPPPMFMCKNYGTPEDAYGVGEPEIVQYVKKTLDYITSAITENIVEHGDPIVKVLRTYYDKENSIPTGKQIILDHPNDFMRESPPNIPVSSYQFIELLLRLNELGTGVQEVSMGKTSPNATSGTAIYRLQQAAQTIIRHKSSRVVDPMMRDAGKFALWAITHNDSGVQQLQMKSKVFVDYDPDAMRGLPFAVKAVPGTALKEGRIEAEERALAMMERGIYGIENVVEHLADDNKKELIEQYYYRNELGEAKELIDGMREIEDEFNGLVEQLIRMLESEGGTDSMMFELTIKQIKQFVFRFPMLLQRDHYKILPPEVQDDILSVFLTEGAVADTATT